MCIRDRLAPGGHSLRNGDRAPMQPALRLVDGYGFAAPADVDAFVPTPDIVIQRSIVGSIAIDERYRLDISDSIVDAGLGVTDAPAGPLAIGAATNPATTWGAALNFDGLTCFCLLYTSPSPRDRTRSRMPSSA